MAEGQRTRVGALVTEARSEIMRGWRVMLARGPSQVQFWFLALLIGVAAGFAALLFRKGIDWLQLVLYGADEPVYTFPGFTLGTNATVTVYTTRGPDSAYGLHWGLSKALWGESGATVELRDGAGKQIATYTTP